MATTLIRKGQYECCKRVLTELLAKFRTSEVGSGDESHLLHQWKLEHNIRLCEALQQVSTVHNGSNARDLEKLLYQIQGLPPSNETLFLQTCVFFNWCWYNVRSGKLRECHSSCLKWAMEILMGVCSCITASSPSVSQRGVFHLHTILDALIDNSEALTKMHLLIVQLVGSLLTWFLIHVGDLSALGVIAKVELLQNKCIENFSKTELIDRYLNTHHESNPSVKNIIFLSDIPKDSSIDCCLYSRGFVIYTLAACHILEKNPDTALDVLETSEADIGSHFIFYVKGRVLWFTILCHVSSTQVSDSNLEKLVWEKRFIALAILRHMKGDVNEAKNIAWALLESKGKSMESWLKARLCNIVGCALSAEKKLNLSLSWFLQATQEDDMFLLPFWNIAIQLCKIKKSEGVTETLKLLAELARRQNASDEVRNVFSHDNFQYLEVLHFKARWFMYQRDFHEACLVFDKILSLLKEGYVLVVRKGEEKTVHRSIFTEAAYAYLRSSKMQKCIETTSSGLAAFSWADLYLGWPESKACTSNCGVVEGLDMGIASIKRGRENDAMTTNCHPYESNQLELTKSDEHCKKPFVNSLLGIRASAYYLNGDFAKCGENLKEIKGTILDIDWHELDESSNMMAEDSIQNPAKRIRLGEDLPSGECQPSHSSQEVEHPYRNNICANAYDLMKSQVYSNLAVLSIQQGHWQDAVHLLRVAMIHCSGNWDAIYNYTLLLLKINRFAQAKRTWCNAWKKLVGQRGFSVEAMAHRLDQFSITEEQIASLHEVLEL